MLPIYFRRIFTCCYQERFLVQRRRHPQGDAWKWPDVRGGH